MLFSLWPPPYSKPTPGAPFSCARQDSGANEEKDAQGLLPDPRHSEVSLPPSRPRCSQGGIRQGLRPGARVKACQGLDRGCLRDHRNDTNQVESLVVMI